MIYYVYVLYDSEIKNFYTGFTNDLRRRLKEHRSGHTKSTRKMKNAKLVYFEGCLNKDDAAERERQLKTGFGRGYLKRRLKSYLGL